MERIAYHEAELTANALERLTHIDGLRICGVGEPQHASERLGVMALKPEPHPHALVAAVLATEFGIGVRNGCFCAHPYLMYLLGLTQDELRQVRISMEAGDRSAIPGMVRVSFGIYNTIDDVNMLAEALGKITRGEYQGKYTRERASGEYSALGWSPDLSPHFTLSGELPPAHPEDLPRMAR